MKRLVLILLPLFLISCASTPKEQHNGVGFDMPETWQADGGVAGEVRPEWWNSFGSPELAGAVRQALARNHDLGAAVARLDAAAAQARIAGADRFPNLNASFDAMRQQRNFIGFPIPGSEEEVLQARFNSFGLAMNVSWELDLWGRVRAGRKAALAEMQASAADLAAAQNSIAAQTAKSWLAVIEAQEQLALASRTAENYRTTTEQVRSRYERGLRSPLDLRLAAASQASAEALVAQRRNELQALVRQLEILQGRYPAGTKISGALPDVPGPVPAGLPSELLERRPDILAAEQRVSAAQSRRKQAQAARLPRISLTASGGTASDDLSKLLDADFSVWTLAGNLVQPIFEGGRLRAGVDLASARMREAVEDYATVALRAFGEVETSLASEGWLADRERDLVRAANQSRAALKLAEQRYRSGLENFATVLEAQRRLFDAESQLLAVRRARLDSRVDLHLALGGSFTEPGLTGFSVSQGLKK